MYNEFERTMDIVIRHLKINDSSLSIPTDQSAWLLASFDLAAAVMHLVNVIAKEISLLTTTYLDMCKALNDSYWSSIILNMTEKGRREWVTTFMPYGDN